MDNNSTKNIWSIIEEILRELNFSTESIKKVKTDLENLAKAETTTKLLEELSEEQQRNLRNQVTDRQETDKKAIIQNYLIGVYNQERIANQMFLSTQSVIKDYMEHLFSKVNDKHQKQILTNFITQVQTG